MTNEPNYFRDRLNQMISEGFVKFELTPCLCGSKNFTTIFKFDSYQKISFVKD